MSLGTKHISLKGQTGYNPIKIKDGKHLDL